MPRAGGASGVILCLAAYFFGMAASSAISRASGIHKNRVHSAWNSDVGEIT
jgi:hypothetical protein